MRKASPAVADLASRPRSVPSGGPADEGGNVKVRTLGPVLAAGMVAVVLVAAGPPAQAQPVAKAAGAASSQAETITNNLARLFAPMLGDPAVKRRVSSAVAAGPVDLLTVESGSSFAKAARGANQALLAAKGLPATTGSILQVQLAHPDMAAAIARGESPLVAGATSDDAVTSVTAYGPNGASVLLDANRLPAQPTLVIDVNVTKAMSVGLELVRDQLAAAGLGGHESSAADTRVSGGGSSIMADPYLASRIDYVWLGDDHEPWTKGAAEIFSIVGGFGLDGAPTIDIVQMPYLDHDGTNYYPYQVLVHWNPARYLYNFADVVMMEDDGGTNYQALTTALVQALATISGLGGYLPLVNSILQAIPGGWWTDDPDYVDSWYTLSTSHGGGYGASGNGYLVLTSVVIEPCC